MLRTKSELIEIVGPDRYARECRLALTEAEKPDYGRIGAAPAPTLDLPHELEKFIWREGEASWAARIELLFAIYDEMPAYAHLMYASSYFVEFSPADRQQWWSAVRARLSEPHAELRQPLQHALWCDFFEDPNTVDEAWNELAGPHATPALLKSVLPFAGPVPFRLKAPLYHRLVDDATWHEVIYYSLLGSTFDVYGDVDRRVARLLLGKLQLLRGLAGVEELRQALR